MSMRVRGMKWSTVSVVGAILLLGGWTSVEGQEWQRGGSYDSEVVAVTTETMGTSRATIALDCKSVGTASSRTVPRLRISQAYPGTRFRGSVAVFIMVGGVSNEHSPDRILSREDVEFSGEGARRIFSMLRSASSFEAHVRGSDGGSFRARWNTGNSLDPFDFGSTLSCF